MRVGLRRALVHGSVSAVTVGNVGIAISVAAMLAAGPRLLGPGPFVGLGLAWTLTTVFGYGLAMPTEQLITNNPEINCIYAHNDEMALGAVAALQAAGVQPGEVKIITIDGTKGAVQGLVDGWISGVIESNPRFGPLAFKALADFYSGAGVPVKTIISDKEYTKDNAASELVNAY